MLNPRLNWVKSTPDPLELKYGFHLMAANPMAAPAVVSLRSVQSPVKDQKNTGSCSGFATVGAVEALEIKEKQVFISKSELQLYYGERKIEGTTDQDAGATTLRDACTVVTQTGVCSELLWPYDESKVFVEPDAAAYADAALHKNKVFYALEGLAELKHCLASGYPFVFGTQVSQRFMDAFTSGLGDVPEWDYTVDQSEGGHALLCVGYDDTRKRLTFKNSWGLVGDKGYGTLTYDYMMNMAGDFFTIRDIPTQNP